MAGHQHARRLAHWGGACAVGGGIWAMHFIGMLAYQTPMSMQYDPWYTLLSMLTAIAVACGVLAILGRDRLTIPQIGVGAILLGFGICAMHYVGMAAMRMDADLYYVPSIFLASLLISIVFSGAALWISFVLARHKGKYHHLLQAIAALIMGAAICGIHYTGMEAAVFIPHADCRYDPSQDFSSLAMIVTAVSGIILAATSILAISRKEKSLSYESMSYTFPTKLLTVSLLLTIAVIVWMGSNGFYIHYFLTHDVMRDQRIAKQADEILYLDSVRTQALRTTATGDVEFDKRYNEALAKGIDKKIDSLQDKELRDITLAMNEASDREAELDIQYLDLMKKGQFETAEKLIHGDEYNHNGQLHMEGRQKLSEKVRQASQANILHLENNIYMTLLLVLASIVILSVSWYFVLRSIGKWRDELQAAQRVSAEALKQAEQANAAKTDFLANMSHELRTPLNSILGMLKLLKGGSLDEEQKELVSTALNSSNSLLEIVNDILDLSKIEANEVELECIGFDLQYVFHSTMLTFRLIAEEKRIALITDHEKQELPYVIGDPTRFARILVNLISNAVKYTERGQVEVCTAIQKIHEEKIELYCEVKDTGIGISPEKQKSIFEKFVQADSSTTRKYGGTGLGLAITKQLVELMGGTIGVESRLGRGATFWFKIPFEVTNALTHVKGKHREREQMGIVPVEQALILIAEDHPMNQLYIKKLMKRFGIPNYDIVNDGADAVRRCKETRWDVILMDCHMPEMNGYDATAEIRNLEKRKEVTVPVPIVAMTANAMVGDREKCLRCGMDDYISKPVDIDELKEVLRQWIRFSDDEVTAKEKAMVENEVPAKSQVATIVDLSHLRAFTGDDRDMEKEFIRVFIEQSDVNVRDLEKSQAEQGQGKIWQEAAHMFKGAAAGIGAEGLRALCDQAQHLDISAVQERPRLFEQIKTEYENVKDYLKGQKLVE